MHIKEKKIANLKCKEKKAGNLRCKGKSGGKIITRMHTLKAE